MLIFSKVFLRSLLFISAFFSVSNINALAETDFHRDTHDRHWVGLSAFGIQSANFQGKICKDFIKTVLISPDPAIAILYNTFGNDNRCLIKFWKKSIKLGKTFLTEVHFSNEAGRRASNLDDFDILPDVGVDEYNLLLEEMPKWLEKEIRLRAREILALTSGYEEAGKFVLSTGLEDNYTPLAWENLYNVLVSEWPYSIVRNPVQTAIMKKMGWTPPEDIIMEYHGYTKKFKTDNLCITNGDGQDVNFLLNTGLNFRDSKSANMRQVSKWMDNARNNNCVTLIWVGKWQGWYNHLKASAPLDRKFEFHTEDVPIIAPLLNPEILPVKRKNRKK